jgi:hypothetical protein
MSPLGVIDRASLCLRSPETKTSSMYGIQLIRLYMKTESPERRVLSKRHDDG